MCTIAAAALLLSMAAALSPAPSCADLFAALPPDSWLVRWRGPSLEAGCDDSWQPLLAPRLEVVLHSRHASDHVFSRIHMLLVRNPCIQFLMANFATADMDPNGVRMADLTA